MAPKTFVILPLDWEHITASPDNYSIKVNYFKNGTQKANEIINFSINEKQSSEFKENNPPQPKGIFIKTEHLIIAVLIFLLFFYNTAIVQKE